MMAPFASVASPPLNPTAAKTPRQARMVIGLLMVSRKVERKALTRS